MGVIASRELKVQIIGDSSSLERALSKSSSSATSFGSKMASAAKVIGKAALVAGAAVATGLVYTLKRGFDELAESQKVLAQTEAVIKSTGKAAGVTAKQVESYASSLSQMSGVDDEVIQSGENMLLTFTNIRNEAGKGNDIFRQSTKTLLDMSVALGQDMPKSAIQLGKALNDPIKGLTALQRVGVTFTESQKKMITGFVESGNIMGAQKVILKELNKEFGGSAKAFGETMPGQLSKLRNAFDELAGKLAAKLLPALNRVLEAVNKNWPQIAAIAEKAMDMLVSAVGTAIATVRTHFSTIKTVAQTAFQGLIAVGRRVVDFFKSDFGQELGIAAGSVLLLRGAFAKVGVSIGGIGTALSTLVKNPFWALLIPVGLLVGHLTQNFIKNKIAAAQLAQIVKTAGASYDQLRDAMNRLRQSHISLDQALLNQKRQLKEVATAQREYSKAVAEHGPKSAQALAADDRRKQAWLDLRQINLDVIEATKAQVDAEINRTKTLDASTKSIAALTAEAVKANGTFIQGQIATKYADALRELGTNAQATADKIRGVDPAAAAAKDRAADMAISIADLTVKLGKVPTEADRAKAGIARFGTDSATALQKPLGPAERARAAIGKVGDGAAPAAGKVASEIGGKVPGALDKVLGPAERARAGLMKVGDGAPPAAAKVTTATGQISGSLDKILGPAERARAGLMKVGDGAGPAAAKTKAGLGQIPGHLKGVEGPAGKAKDSLGKVGDGAAESSKKAKAEFGKVSGILAAEIGRWAGLAGQARGAGAAIGISLGAGIVSGIASMVGAIIVTAASAVTAGVNAARAAAEAHSDSRLMIALGTDLINGLISGIKKMTPELQKTLNASLQTLTTAAGAAKLGALGDKYGKDVVASMMKGMLKAGETVTPGLLATKLGEKHFPKGFIPEQIKKFGPDAVKEILKGFQQESQTKAGQFKAAMATLVANAKQAVTDAREGFKSAFGELISNALSAFDEIAGKWKPPSLVLLDKLNFEEQQQQLKDAITKAGDDLAKAQAEATAKLAEGAAPEDIAAAQAKVVEAQKAMDAAVLAQVKDGLQRRGQVEQEEHDALMAADRARLEQRLLAIQQRYAKEAADGTVNVRKMNKEIAAVLAESGIDSEKAGMAISLQLAAGITKAVQAVTVAATKLARVVKKLLALKSNAEEGPLSDIESWWLPIGPMLGAQVDRAIPMVKAAAGRLGLGLKEGLDPAVTASKAGLEKLGEGGWIAAKGFDGANTAKGAFETNMEDKLIPAIDASKAKLDDLKNSLKDDETGFQMASKAAWDYYAALQAIGTVSMAGPGPPPGAGQTLQGRQHGGPVRRKWAYIVGEHGPELFVPRSGGHVLSNHDMERLFGNLNPHGDVPLTHAPAPPEYQPFSGGNIADIPAGRVYQRGNLLGPWVPNNRLNDVNVNFNAPVYGGTPDQMARALTPAIMSEIRRTQGRGVPSVTRVN